MFTSKVMNSGFFIYYAAVQSIDSLRMNYFAYIVGTSVDSVLLLVWVILYSGPYGFAVAGYYLYIAYGAGLAFKVIVDALGIKNMDYYMQELQAPKDEDMMLEGFEDF